jgi:hypothetical protein
VQHFLLLDYNFPSEAFDCILRLFAAMELLLREYFKNKYTNQNVFTLIETYWEEDESAKDLGHWLREGRNKLVHKGEPKWKDKNIIPGMLRECFIFISGIYEDLGFSISDDFSTLEQHVIEGKIPDWDDEAVFLAREAVSYLQLDPPIMFDIASAATEKAIRGFARAWRIQGADVIPIEEIFDALRHYEYKFESKYNRSEHTAPYAPEYIFPGEVGNEIRELWVAKNLDDVYEWFRSGDYTDEMTMRLYLQDNQGLVENLANRYPSLDFYECFCGNWDSLMQEMKNVYPQIELP